MDRMNGNPVTNNDRIDFAGCIQENELTEVKAVGGEFTWCNNQDGDNRIYSNIDRCLATVDWFTEYSHVVVDRLERGISDHCPQLIDFDIGMIFRKSPFKFFNIIADHPDFEGIVKREWEAHGRNNKLLDIWFKCKSLKKPLKDINTREFKKTTEKVAEVRLKLKMVQQQLKVNISNTQLIEEENRVMKELDKWSSIEEKIWHQKARIDWLKMGDSNTKFFHAYVKYRQNINAIKLLKREDGSRCITNEEMQREVRDFYEKLMGSAAPELPMVDRMIVERGERVGQEHQRTLCEECTNSRSKGGVIEHGIRQSTWH